MFLSMQKINAKYANKRGIDIVGGIILLLIFYYPIIVFFLFIEIGEEEVQRWRHMNLSFAMKFLPQKKKKNSDTISWFNLRKLAIYMYEVTLSFSRANWREMRS